MEWVKSREEHAGGGMRVNMFLATNLGLEPTLIYLPLLVQITTRYCLHVQRQHSLDNSICSVVHQWI